MNQPIPISPEGLNDILDTPAIRYSCDEATEVALKREAEQIARQLGPEAMKDFIVMFSLPFEAEIRQDPDHPAIPLLDEYHARRAGSD